MKQIDLVTITYLELEHDTHVYNVCPHGKIAIIHAEKPPIHFYRYLYENVGKSCGWEKRNTLNDFDLGEIIHDSAVEIYVLYVDGCPAGYAEVDFRRFPEVELAYLGFIKEYLHQGYDEYFLKQTIATIWLREPKKIKAKLSSLDHSFILPIYQKCGFIPIAQEEVKMSQYKKELAI